MVANLSHLSTRRLAYYILTARVAPPLQAHLAQARTPDYRRAAQFSADPAASWVWLPGAATVSHLEHENDLIATHPSCVLRQFLFVPALQHFEPIFRLSDKLPQADFNAGVLGEAPNRAQTNEPAA